jgi:oxalate decarboxylase/phosphoglucose isomerase-like protein (cupin superfamily)
VPLKPWPRKNGKGAFINLEGTGQTDDAYVCEIPPGKSSEPEKYLFEELIYVLSGRGATTIWTDGGAKQTFEWQEGSLFSPPLNTWRQHFNGQGNRPARFLAVTSAPMVINLFHNLDFIFNNGFAFRDRYDESPDYFSAKGKAHPRRIWESNFIPDVRTFKLQEWKERGAGGSNVMFELAENTLCAHISEFPVGTYKKAHRHGPGAHVIIISGKGYSLMWPEGTSKKEIEWRAGSMFVPPDRWFHQHFNAGGEPARYLALRWGSQKHRMGTDVRLVDRDVREGGDQIEYDMEDPEVLALFKKKCAAAGATVKMDSFFHKAA